MTKEDPELRKKKIIHRAIDRIDEKIKILIKVRERLAQLEQKDQQLKTDPTSDLQESKILDQRGRKTGDI